MRTVHKIIIIYNLLIVFGSMLPAFDYLYSKIKTARYKEIIEVKE